MKIVLFSIITLVGALTCLNAAQAQSTEDKLLLSMGIVDSDYRYVDIDAANEFFLEQTVAVVKTLPAARGNIEMIDVLMTPYYGDLKYRFTDVTSEEDITALKTILSTGPLFQKITDDTCNKYYLNSKYMMANDVTLVYTYVDAYYNKVGSIKLNNEVCTAAKN